MTLTPEAAVYNPAGAEYASRAGGKGMRLLFGFARDRFSSIV